MACHMPGPTAGAQGAPRTLLRPCTGDWEGGREDRGRMACTAIPQERQHCGLCPCARGHSVIVSTLDTLVSACSTGSSCHCGWKARLWGRARVALTQDRGCPASMGFVAAKSRGPRTQETWFEKLCGLLQGPGRPCQGLLPGSEVRGAGSSWDPGRKPRATGAQARS